MKRSCREFSIDVVIHLGIVSNMQMTLFPCFNYLKQVLVFTVYLFTFFRGETMEGLRLEKMKNGIVFAG